MEEIKNEVVSEIIAKHEQHPEFIKMRSEIDAFNKLINQEIIRLESKYFDRQLLLTVEYKSDSGASVISSTVVVPNDSSFQDYLSQKREILDSRYKGWLV